MAQTIRCDGCEERPADLLVTSIHDGKVLAFDLQCSGLWAEGHAAAMKELFGVDDPGDDDQAGSVELGAADDDPPYPLPPLEQDPVAIRLGLVDTPDTAPPGSEAGSAATLPAEGVPGEEAAAGGENDGSVREHDRGADAGDRRTADPAGTDRPGPDRRGGQGGSRAGRAGGKRSGPDAASGKPAGQRRAADTAADTANAVGDGPVTSGP